MPYHPLPIPEWNKFVASMSEDEYSSLSPFRKRNCGYCVHLVGHVSRWCGDKEAIGARGTSIPGVANCNYWKPDWGEIPKEYRTQENGWVKPKGWANRLMFFIFD